MRHRSLSLALRGALDHVTGLHTGLVAGLMLAVTLAACTKPADAPEPVRSVRTMTVEAGLATSALDYAAEVRARVESRLAFRVAGKMVTRPVSVGDTVKAGQVLASLDPQDLRLGQEASRSSVQAARVNHEQASGDFTRFKDLRDQGFISAAELERRENTLKAAKAQLDQAAALAGVQSNQARYSNLVAEVGGVVTAVEAEPGAVLSAGATVLRLANDGPRDVVFSVPEDQVAALRALIGQANALRVRLWGASAATLPAAVREVGGAADPATRTFVVKADIGDVPVQLGQTANVSLALPPVAGIIKLPLAAVFEQQGKSHVWLLDPGAMTVNPRAVQVAGAEGNQVVVAAGLKPGDQVVTAGVHVLTPGQKVARFNAPAAPAASATAAAASAASR